MLDSGMSYSALASLAMSASGAKDADAIVEKLYTNVLLTKPTTAEKAPFVQMLNSGMSSGDLVVLAADTASNQTNIGLTGLATTGIEYQ
jgi:serralysin